MIDEETRQKLDAAIEEQHLWSIHCILNDLPAQDISDYLEEWGEEEIKATLFRLLTKDLAVEVFEHLEFEEQELLLNSLKQERIIEILEEMDPDDRTELFEEMPAKVVNHYLRHLSREERLVATKLLGYPDESVGRRMTTDYVSFRPHVTVGEALASLKVMALDKETIYHCYIIDSTRKLVGYASLKMLLLAEPEQKLEEIMDPDVIALNARDDQEHAAREFKHYDLLALPVVDSEIRLVGIVTFDDLVDVLEEETTEDIQRMAAIVPEEHPYFDTGFFTMAGKRVLWLSILLVAQLFSGMILRGFEASLKATVALAFFIPMLMATGGNTGAQSSAIIIRALAVGEIRVRQFLMVVFRELRIGIVLGFGLCILGFAASYTTAHIFEFNAEVSIVLGISVTLTVIAAAVIGAALPLIFRAMKLDPALMSGPFITTLVDIVGLLIYFNTAAIVFGM